MKKIVVLPLFLVAFVLLAACSPKSGSEASAGAEAARAAGATRLLLTEDGKLFLDGEALSIGDLAARVEEIKARDGSIWYHRAGPREQRPPQAMQVLNTLVAAQVPVQLFEDAAFTRPLGMNSGNAPALR